MSHKNPKFVLPAGTRVVTSAEVRGGGKTFAKGTIGVIVESPADHRHKYCVRFMNGTEVWVKRREFSVHKQFQRPVEPEEWQNNQTLKQYVIYRCVVGSKAYGLDEEGSDTDLRGIYLPPADLHWSLYGVPEQIELSDADESYWELQKFIMLALKANPNIMECLYTPLVEYAAPITQEMLDGREMFLSKLVYQTYNGYVMSQFRKLKKDIKNHGQIRWKHAMHLIRLLQAGIGVLRDGVIQVHVGDQREALMTIRHGDMPWDEIDRWRIQLHKEFDEAYEQTSLPERPDYERVNEFLVKARRSAL